MLLTNYLLKIIYIYIYIYIYINIWHYVTHNCWYAEKAQRTNLFCLYLIKNALLNMTLAYWLCLKYLWYCWEGSGSRVGEHLTHSTDYNSARRNLDQLAPGVISLAAVIYVVFKCCVMSLVILQYWLSDGQLYSTSQLKEWGLNKNTSHSIKWTNTETL